MATITKRGRGYQVKIRKTDPYGKFQQISRVFQLRRDADRWARETEASIELADTLVMPTLPICRSSNTSRSEPNCPDAKICSRILSLEYCLRRSVIYNIAKCTGCWLSRPCARVIVFCSVCSSHAVINRSNASIIFRLKPLIMIVDMY